MFATVAFRLSCEESFRDRVVLVFNLILSHDLVKPDATVRDPPSLIVDWACWELCRVMGSSQYKLTTIFILQRDHLFIIYIYRAGDIRIRS